MMVWIVRSNKSETLTRLKLLDVLRVFVPFFWPCGQGWILVIITGGHGNSKPIMRCSMLESAFSKLLKLCVFSSRFFFNCCHFHFGKDFEGPFQHLVGDFPPNSSKRYWFKLYHFPMSGGVNMSTFFETTSPRNSVPSSAHRTQRRWARCWKTRPRYLRGLWSVWIWKIPAVTSYVPNKYGLKNANFSGMMMVNNPLIRLLQGRWHWVCTHSFPVPVAK